MGSKGRCESASAVRPAAFHASGQVGSEPTQRSKQPGLFSLPGVIIFVFAYLVNAGKRT